MFRYVPANVAEVMPRHEKTKIISYNDYRNYMKEQENNKKTLRDNQMKIDEYNDLVIQNSQAIENLGPVEIFETSKRVRDSISWNKRKRYAEIEGERVDPE